MQTKGSNLLCAQQAVETELRQTPILRIVDPAKFDEWGALPFRQALLLVGKSPRSRWAEIVLGEPRGDARGVTVWVLVEGVLSGRYRAEVTCPPEAAGKVAVQLLQDGLRLQEFPEEET